MQRHERAFGHVDVGARVQCCLKLGDGFSGFLPAAGVTDRLTGGNAVQAHEFSIELIECGCGVAVDVQRAGEFLLTVGAFDH